MFIIFSSALHQSHVKMRQQGDLAWERLIMKYALKNVVCVLYCADNTSLKRSRSCLNCCKHAPRVTSYFDNLLY